MLVFDKKIETRFFRIKFFMQAGSPKKVRFPLNAIITWGQKLCKIDVFEVRYLENDNGGPPPPPFLLHFLIEGVKIYNIEKYE